MFIVGKSFFNKILSKFNIKTIAPLCLIHIHPCGGLIMFFLNFPFRFSKYFFINFCKLLLVEGVQSVHSSYQAEWWCWETLQTGGSGGGSQCSSSMVTGSDKSWLICWHLGSDLPGCRSTGHSTIGSSKCWIMFMIKQRMFAVTVIISKPP